MRNIKKTICIVIIINLMNCTSNAKYWESNMDKPISEENTKLYELVNNSVNIFSLPGLQAGYKHSGEEPQIASGGTIDFKRKKGSITNQHAFHIGSATKMFMGVLFLRYVEQGKIDLNSPIDIWFPDYPDGSSIMVKNLLNHTSGINETLFLEPTYLLGSVINKHKIWNPNNVLPRITNSKSPISFDQRQFLYSNNNYLMLGIIAEQIDGIRLSDILKKEFFIPLQMNNTALLPGGSNDLLNVVSGYDYYIPFGPHLIRQDQTSWDSLTFAAGAMVSNTSDLLIWIEALFNNKIISFNSLQKMMEWTNSTNNGRDNSMIGYGLGLAKYSIEDSVLIGHPGAGFGGVCFPFWSPETNTAYVVMYNVSKKDNPAGKKLLAQLLLLSNTERSNE